MRVPRLGVKLELLLAASAIATATWYLRCVCDLCTAAHSNTGSLTHQVRPGMGTVFSWILVRFITAEPR